MSTFSRHSIPVKPALKALSVLKPLISSNGFHKQWQFVRVEIDRYGTWISALATHCEYSARIRIDDGGTSGGSALLNYKQFVSALKSIKTERVSIEWDGASISLDNGTDQIGIESIGVDELPPLPKFAAQNWRYGSAADLRRAFELTVPFTCETARYALNAVRVESQDDRLRFVATDGTRLIQYDLHDWYVSSDNHNAKTTHNATFERQSVTTDNAQGKPVSSEVEPLIYWPAANLISACVKLAPKDATVYLAWSPTEGLAVSIDGVAEIFARPVAGRFPDYQNCDVIPAIDQCRAFFDLDSSELQNAIELVKTSHGNIDKKDDPSVHFLIDPDEDRVYVENASSDGKTSKYTRAFKTFTKGEACSFSLSVGLTLEILKTINAQAKSKTTQLEFRTPGYSGAVTISARDTLRIVMMPKTYDKQGEKSKVITKQGNECLKRLTGKSVLPSEPTTDTPPVEPEVEPTIEPPVAIVVPPVVVEVANPAPEPSPIPEPKPEPKPRKETPDEKRIRLRQEARAEVREYPDEFQNELRYARERLAEKRAECLNWIRAQWREHVESIIFNAREERREYIEKYWDDIKSVRRQWLALPENVQRLREQRERQPIKHRLKFSLFGFQTPDERPYAGIEAIPQPPIVDDSEDFVEAPESEDSPLPDFLGCQETTVTPVCGFQASVALVVAVSEVVTTFTTDVPETFIVGFSDGWTNNYYRTFGEWENPLGYGNAFTFGQWLWSQLSENWLQSLVNWTYSIFDVHTMRSYAFPVILPSDIEPIAEVSPEPLPEPLPNVVAETLATPIPPVPVFSGPRKPVEPPAALSITIKGQSYGLEILPGGVFRLASPKGDVYDVFPSDDLVQANHGVVCSCPDHEKRHAGLPTKGCKHANALRAVGLLPSVVLTPPAGPDGSDDPVIPGWFDESVAWIPGEDSADHSVVSSDRGAVISDLTPEPPVSAFLGSLPPVCGAEVDEDEEVWDTERFARERCPVSVVESNPVAPRITPTMKTLADFKRAMKPGVQIECIENTYRPELNGTRRIVATVDTVKIGWITTFVDRLSYTDFPKAKDVVKVQGDIFQFRLFPGKEDTVTLKVLG